MEEIPTEKLAPRRGGRPKGGGVSRVRVPRIPKYPGKMAIVNERGHVVSFTHKITIYALWKRGDFTKKELARDCDLSVDQVDKIITDPEITILDNSQIPSVKKLFANLFAHVSMRAASFITDEKLMASSAYQLAGIAALMYDKNRLAEGQSTSNVSIRTTIGEAVAELERIRAEKLNIGEALDSQSNAEEPAPAPKRRSRPPKVRPPSNARASDPPEVGDPPETP